MRKLLVVFLLITTYNSPYTGWTQMATSAIIKPKAQTLTAAQILQALNAPTTQATQPVYNFNFGGQAAITQFCPFLTNFQAAPSIPTPADVPTDTFANLQNFVTNFNNSINTLRTYINNYSAAVKNWQTNNALQAFSTLIKTMQTNNTTYNTAKSTHDTCVANKAASTTTQPGCNTELMNYITATNALYDSFANILTTLNSYNLAPTWANPVTRMETAATFPDTNGKPVAFVYNGQTIAINNIKGFESKSFTNQINIGIGYLQNQMSSCYAAIKQINSSFSNLNTAISNTANAIHNAATTLQQQNQASSSQVATIEGDVGQGLNVFMNIAPSAYATAVASKSAGEFIPVADLEMPEFTVFNLYLNNLAALTGANNEPLSQFMTSVSNQMNKGMIDNWSAIDWASSGGWASGGNEWDITKALGYTVATLAVGAVTPLTTLVDTVSNLLSGGLSAQQAGSAITQAANPYCVFGGC